MSGTTTAAEGPAISILDLVAATDTAAFDWQNSTGTQLQRGTARGFIWVTGPAGSTPSITVQIQTSMDGTNWVEGTAAFTAVTTSASFQFKDFTSTGVLPAKPLKYIRLHMTANTTTFTAGTIRWGLI